MECSKCEFNLKGDPVCIACARSNPNIPLSRHGVSTVSLDSDAVEGSELLRQESTSPAEPYTRLVPEDIAYSLSSFFRAWLRLPPVSREIVAELACRELDGANHPTLADLGEKYGLTKSGVKYKLSAACAQIPEIRALFPRMTIA